MAWNGTGRDGFLAESQVGKRSRRAKYGSLDATRPTSDPDATTTGHHLTIYTHTYMHMHTNNNNKKNNWILVVLFASLMTIVDATLRRPFTSLK